MKRPEIKLLIISSLDPGTDAGTLARQIEDSGVSYDFNGKFTDRVLDKIFGAELAFNREIEFVRKLNSAFYRVALTGVAAILLLLISIFLMEGSLSINSFLGIGDTYDESIVCLFTDN
ncbi:MAG TPA: hypothetical protein DDW27_09440 [Bacteroidales bacterium]|nr:hypothetical protein [Bacteroidales bacterium]